MSALSKVIFTLAFAILANAIPNAKSCSAVSQNANFDDLTGVPGIELNKIPIPYKGLYYQGFGFTVVVQTNTLPGVVPHSSPNYASSDVVNQMSGTPMLTVNYPGTTVKSFSLDSFYYGCVLNGENGAAAVPIMCNVEVTGYIGPDNTVSGATQVCSRQFQYNPTTAIGVQQQAFSGAISGCTGISFAIITFTLPGGLAAASADLALVLDDIKYSTKSC